MANNSVPRGVGNPRTQADISNNNTSPIPTLENKREGNGNPAAENKSGSMWNPATENKMVNMVNSGGKVEEGLTREEVRVLRGVVGVLRGMSGVEVSGEWGRCVCGHCRVWGERMRVEMWRAFGGVVGGEGKGG